ncbi:hypothetical protein JHK87_010166 [Glycine soja]|nr:hypothetical protein JHK87_010166 [Glycine soja]
MVMVPVPCINEDAIAVTILKEEYKEGLEECKNNLNGRIILSMGDQPSRVLAVGAWDIKPGILWLFTLSLDFNPSTDPPIDVVIDNNLGTISLEKDGAVNNNEFVSPIVQQDLRIVSRLWVNEVEEEDIGTS